MRKLHRIIIYPSDFAIWFGRKDVTGSRYYLDVKNYLGLKENQPLTIFHIRDLWEVTLEDISWSLGF